MGCVYNDAFSLPTVVLRCIGHEEHLKASRSRLKGNRGFAVPTKSVQPADFLRIQVMPSEGDRCLFPASFEFRRSA